MRARWAVAAATGILVLSACSAGATVPTARDTSTDVPFNGCDVVACEGSIEGAAYEILLPETWNGTLLIYSHGYRAAQPFPPQFEPSSTAATPAPGWDSGVTEVADALLERGYALVGSAYSANGWAVEEGVAAGEQLYEFFRTNVAEPRRVYVWGDSLGGLITATIAEKHADWVDGAAPFCGAVAGLLPNMGLALDTAYAVQQLIDPGMTISSFSSYEDAVAAWEGAASLLVQSARDQDTEAIAKIFTVAALVDAPGKTRTFDGSTIVSQVSGTIESLLTALGFGTVGRFDVEQRYGGPISGNEDTDYSLRIDDAERERIDAIGGEGATDRFLATLASGQRVSADPTAQAEALARGGDPTGRIQDPMITLHTSDDPLVIVQNETFFGDRVAQAEAAGEVRGGLVQLYTVPPATFPQDPGAPYGAGHCNFTLDSRLAVIDLLDAWVREGVFPGQGAISAAMGQESGYNALFQPGPWPNPQVTP